MYGWAGTILDIDLSSGKIEKRPFDIEMGKKYLGGRGVHSRMLCDELKPGVDPLSPENVLIFGTGPFGGTIAPSSSRMNVSAKPCTYKGVGTSNVGGGFPVDLKKAGYDHVIFRGRAEEPVYVWIDDDRIELRPAGHLWGKNTWDTYHVIKGELGGDELSAALIGQAGENLVTFANIMFTPYRAAGQTGMGAIMGTKNLKAVTVRGTGRIKAADPERLKNLSRQIVKAIMNNPAFTLVTQYGTPFWVPMYDGAGMTCIRNFQGTGNWAGIENFAMDKLIPYYKNPKGCYGCILRCGHLTEIPEGPYKGEKGGAIEAEHIWPLGFGLDNTDLSSVVKSAYLANEYGMDTMELGYTIAPAMEWYEKGIITQKDTDGISLEWGHKDAIIEMIHKIAKREGFGDLLADGVLEAAKKIGKGAEAYVSHCKGVPMGSQDTRPSKGGALSQATTTIPGKYEDGSPPEFDPSFLGPEFIEKYYGKDALQMTSYKKAMATIYFQNLARLQDAVEICKIIGIGIAMPVDMPDIADLFSAITGIESSKEDMFLAAERINDVERIFAVREGVTRQDDHLCGKIMREPVQTGQWKGERLDPEKFEMMLDEYYTLRGWDKETGIPTRAKLKSVGLEDLADELERMGKLPCDGSRS
jgi:aldehyde:ferredoxin oxidoreductase